MPNRLPLLAVLLVLASLLLAAGPAHGSAAKPIGHALAFEESFEAEEEDEEGEFEDEGCSEAEVEFELDEIDEAEADRICAEAAEESRRKRDAGSAAPEECLLRSVRAHAAVNDKGNKLKLTLGYTTYEPTSARIEIRQIAKLQRHLSRSGVLRLVKGLDKLDTPKKIVVRISIPSVKRAGCPSRRLVLFPR